MSFIDYSDHIDESFIQFTNNQLNLTCNPGQRQKIVYQNLDKHLYDQNYANLPGHMLVKKIKQLLEKLVEEGGLGIQELPPYIRHYELKFGSSSSANRNGGPISRGVSGHYTPGAPISHVPNFGSDNSSNQSFGSYPSHHAVGNFPVVQPIIQSTGVSNNGNGSGGFVFCGPSSFSQGG